jgi:hypothetical protein
MVDIPAYGGQLRGKRLYVGGIGIDDISVNRHLAEIGAVSLRGQQLHFLVNKPFFVLCDPELHLDISFSVGHGVPPYLQGFGILPRNFLFSGKETENLKNRKWVLTCCACYVTFSSYK